MKKREDNKNHYGRESAEDFARKLCSSEDLPLSSKETYQTTY